MRVGLSVRNWLRPCVHQWIEHGHTDLKQQQSLMDQTRRAIKDKFGQDHFSLNAIKFTTEEYTRLNDEKQRSVAERNEDVKSLENPDAIVAEAVRLLDSPEWAEVSAGSGGADGS